MDERDPRRLYERAVALHRAGKLDEAERHYQAVRRSHPEHPGVLHGLGLIRLGARRSGDAEPLLAAAAMRAPRDGAIRSDLAWARLQLGRFEAAARDFEAALALRPGDAAARRGLGEALSVLGRMDEARAAFTALRAQDAAAAEFGLGTLAMQTGDVDAARVAFHKAIALKPAEPAFHRALAATGRFVEDDARLAALEGLTRVPLTPAQRVELHFALAKAYDDLGRYGDAFAQLHEGNALQHSLVPYDEAAVAAFFAESARVFTPEVLRRATGDPSELPVFVVGMPRSGTSLVEQILASHPAVHGAGELTAIGDLVAEGLAGPDYPKSAAALSDAQLRAFGAAYVARLRPLAPNALRIVDKLPANFRHLGLIRRALSGARIVHVRRDPMDTCFSCFAHLFPNGLNYAYDLGELGRYWRMYDALMAHWRAAGLPMLDIGYEALVADLEGEARRLVAFCGLDWDARCLDFHRSARAVRTLSQAAVRQPIYKSAVGRWRNYEPWLEPLRAALG